jgi:molybdopterin synthase catalytic subunit
MRISVQREDFDAGAEIRKLAGDGSVGALASFVGLVRDVPMTLEHYAGMTEREITKIAHEAAKRWNVTDVTVIHRFGELKPADQIVLVVVAAGHRGEAFAACEFIMDYLKTRAPFWKKERRAGAAEWVEAKASDDAAAERWTAKAKKPRAKGTG